MLSDNIRELRKQNGYTQIQFAKAVHVTQAAVSHWETGRSMPDTQQLFQIAQLFGVSIDQLSRNTFPSVEPSSALDVRDHDEMRTEKQMKPNDSKAATEAAPIRQELAAKSRDTVPSAAAGHTSEAFLARVNKLPPEKQEQLASFLRFLEQEV